MITLNFYTIFVNPFTRISEKTVNSTITVSFPIFAKVFFITYHTFYILPFDLLTTSINEPQNYSDNITYKCHLINGNWQTKSKKIMELKSLDSNVTDFHWEDTVTCNVRWKQVQSLNITLSWKAKYTASVEMYQQRQSTP
jgi:hypothetical protein